MLESLWKSFDMVGVDIGTRVVKVVEVRAASHGDFTVRGVAGVPTPPEAFGPGGEIRTEALGQAIRSALAIGKTRTRRATLAVSPQLGFLRRLAVPKMPLAELRAVIDLQPERYIPFARDGVVYDLNLLLSGEVPEGQMGVVLAAAPRQVVVDLMAAARHAGLRPARIDLEPLALHRAALATGMATREAVAAIIDLGQAVARISILDRDVPVISRVLDVVRDPETGEYTLDTIDELFHDIRRALEFALAQAKSPPERLLLTGGSEANVELSAALTEYIMGYLSNRLPAEFQVVPMAGPDARVPPSHMLALGLSLSPELFV